MKNNNNEYEFNEILVKGYIEEMKTNEPYLDYIKDVIDEIMLLDNRANRLISFIINKVGIMNALADPRMKLFAESSEDTIEYSILVDWVMKLKGLKKTPLDDLIEGEDESDIEFTANELEECIPHISRLLESVIRTHQPRYCGDGLMLIPKYDGIVLNVSKRDGQSKIIKVIY